MNFGSPKLPMIRRSPRFSITGRIRFQACRRPRALAGESGDEMWSSIPAPFNENSSN